MTADYFCFLLIVNNNYKMVVLKGWRYAGFIAGIVGFIGITIYPIVIDPALNPEKYSKITIWK